MEIDEVAEGWEEIDSFYDRICDYTGSLNDRVYDDQGGAQGFLKEGVLPPNGVFAKVPAMVAPDYDESIFTESEFVEAVDNLPTWASA